VDSDVKNTTTAIDSDIDNNLSHLNSDVLNQATQVNRTIGTATKWLAQGDTAFAAKQYDTAYQDYAAAYQAAVK
jgi:hypothetical protein